METSAAAAAGGMTEPVGAPTAAGDPAKLFVGGISWETKEENLSDYFQKYGEVTEAIIMRDRVKGVARGFGFVSFADTSAADRALEDRTSKHVILDRVVEVKRALPRGEKHQNNHHRHHQYNDYSSREFSRSSTVGANDNQSRTKIFVGGLSANLTENEFKSYFEKYGSITDVVVMYDNTTHRARGFGFITFDSEDAVEDVLKKNFHELNGKSVEVKRAVPKDPNNNGNNEMSPNSNGYNFKSRTGYGGGTGFGYYQGGAYYSYPRYDFPYGYMPPFYSGYGYVPYGYGGYRYGPLAPGPRSPSNGPRSDGGRRSPMPYGYPCMYPYYSNGGTGPYLAMSNGGNYGLSNNSDGKQNQNGDDAQAPDPSSPTSSPAEGGKLDDR